MNNEQHVLTVEVQAASLVRLAHDLGLNLTIHLEPLPPLAMGNHRPVVTVWPARSGDGCTAVRAMPPRLPGIYDPKDPATLAQDREAYALINAVPLLQSLLYDLNLLPECIARDDETRWAHMHAVVSHWYRHEPPMITVTEVGPKEAERLSKFFAESGLSVGILSSDPTEPRDAHRGGNSYEASMLRNLLAVIHGDGGHYLEEHGLEKTLADAETLVQEWLAPRGMPSDTNAAPAICVRCKERPGDRVVIGTGSICCHCATDDEAEL